MCAGCPVDAAGQCFEFAYGPRIEAANGQLLVRSCLYRNEEPFVQIAGNFVNHEIAVETYTDSSLSS